MKQNKRFKSGIRRLSASLLAVCMVITGLPDISFAATDRTDRTVAVTEILALPEDTAVRMVPVGTGEEELKLPGSLEAMGYAAPDKTATPSNPEASDSNADDPERNTPKPITITDVKWTADRTYEKDNEGETYTFTPGIGDRYILEDGVKLPEIRVTVMDETNVSGKTVVITSFVGDNGFDPLFTYEVEYGTREADLPLSATLQALAEDGKTVEVPVTWVCTDDSFGGTTYVPEHENEAAWYTFEPVLGEKYEYGGLLPYVTVSYAGVKENLNNKFSGGDGSRDTPWLIETNEDLAELSENMDEKSVFYAEKFFRVNVDGLTVNAPMGVDGSSFGGTFDGNGQEIVLSIDDDGSNTGLFRQIDSVGTVRRLGVSGTVSGDSTSNSTGGIAGKNDGTIENCYSTAEIIGAGVRAGGIVGYNYGGTIKVCYNTGTIAGISSYLGGVAGENSSRHTMDDGIIENCYNTAEIIGDVIEADSYAGGIAGYATGAVRSCYNIGNVYGKTAGGIAGYSTGYLTDNVALNYKVAVTRDCGRITGRKVGSKSSNNKARSDMKLTKNDILQEPSSIGGNGLDGENVTLGEETKQKAVFSNWDTGVWDISSKNMVIGEELPELWGTGLQSAKIPEALETYNVIGVVKDGETGGGLAAKVTLTSRNGGGTGKSVTADENGGYTFGKVAAGDYDVTVSFEGYGGGKATVTVVDADVSVADVLLEREKEKFCNVSVNIFKNDGPWRYHEKTLKIKLKGDTDEAWIERDQEGAIDGSEKVKFKVSAAGTYEVWEFDGASKKAKLTEAVVEKSDLDSSISVDLSYYTVKLTKTEGIDSVSISEQRKDERQGDTGTQIAEDSSSVEWAYLAPATVEAGAVISEGYEWVKWGVTSYGSGAPAESPESEKVFQFDIKEERWELEAQAKRPGYKVTIVELKDDEPWDSGYPYKLEESRTGAYECTDLSDVPVGTYSIWVNKDGYYTLAHAQVEVTADGANTGTVRYYTLSLQKGEGISEVKGGGIFLYDETVWIEAKAEPGYKFTQWIYTKNGFPYKSNSKQEVTVEETTDLTAVAKKPETEDCTLRVDVSGSDNKGMQASVKYKCNSGKDAGKESGLCVTDANGAYTFEHLSPGLYTVSAFCEGYKDGQKNVSVVVEEGGTKVDFILQKETSVSKHAVTVNAYKDGQPWNNHGIRFALKNSSGEMFRDLKNVPDGNYTLFQDITGTGIPVAVAGADAICRVDYYTVTFYDGDTPYTSDAWVPQIVLRGGHVVTHALPEKDGYKFLSWVTGKGSSTDFDFMAPVEKKTDVYASWKSDVRYYTVTISGYTESVTGGGSYQEGDTVTVSTGERPGYTFLCWISASEVQFTDLSSMKTTFIMPPKNVSVSVFWTKNGSSSGGGSGFGSSGGSSSTGSTDTIYTTPPATGTVTDVGSVISATTTNSATGASILTKVNKDAAGGITGVTAEVSDTRPSVTAGDTETKIGVSVDAAAVFAAETAAARQGTGGNPVSLSIKLPADAMVGQLKNQDGKALRVDVAIPRSVAGHSSTPIAEIKLTKDVMAAAGAAGKDLSIVLKDENEKVNAQWMLKADDMKNAGALSDGMNLAVDVKPVKTLSGDKSGVKSASAGVVGTTEQEVPGLAVTLGGSGVLPVQARLRVPAGNNAGINPGDTVYLYYYNPAAGRLESVPENEYKVDAEGFLTIGLSHASDYVLLPKKVNAPKSAGSGSTVHVVKRGDTINMLAKAYGCTVEEILAVNQVPDVYDLKIGQELLIPRA